MGTGRIRAERQPRQAVSLHGLQRTIDQLLIRLDRTDKKVTTLEKKLKKAEAERDEYKAKYAKALVTIREQDKQIKTLTEKVECAEKQLAWFRRDKFGQKSEAETLKEIASKVSGTTVPDRKRGQQPGKPGHGRTKRTGLDEEHIDLDLTNKRCATCSKPFVQLPETDDSNLLQIETLLYQQNFHQFRYVRACRCLGPKIVTPPPPPKLYPRTNIGNSLWVHLCVQKFLQAVPTNRILKDLALRGLGLSAGTVTGGMKIIDDLLEPLYLAISDFCRGQEYWHADETSWRVFSDNSGKRNLKKWWLWVVAGERAVVYILDKSRSRHVPEEFFAGSLGVLMTDRFSAYKSLPLSIRKAWCWVHVRRDFLKLLPLNKHRAWAKAWLIQIGKLFALNHKRFALWSSNNNFGSAWNQISSKLAAHLESMQLAWQQQLQEPLPKQQRTAILSLQKHWSGLTLFLNDPRIPLDNNKAERLLRNCVNLRKNSYGSGVEWVGNLSAKLFTIFQTWLINGFDPQSLLLDYFDHCSATPGKPPPSIDKFLPWKMSEERQLAFRLPSSYKRPA